MIRIGICDDSYDARLNLHFKIDRILESREVKYEIFEFTVGERFLTWLKNHSGELDLIFLDIMMGGQNGMEIARQVRTMDTNIQIAFCTGYKDFVYDGYEVGALGYLLKPAKDEQLISLLTRAISNIQKDSENMFLCKSGEVHYRIPRASILFFYSDKRQVVCVAENKEYTFYSKLDEVAEEMGAEFVRIHQRYLIRAKAVDSISGTEAVIGIHKLPVSRAYQNEAMTALTRTLLE